MTMLRAMIRGVGLAGLLMMAACANVPLPAWPFGEPSSDVTGPAADYEGIQRTDRHQHTYAPLATVPSGPTDVPSQESIDALIHSLETQHSIGQDVLATPPAH